MIAPAPRICRHYWCRCMRSAELAAMGQLQDAIAIHDQAVRCRTSDQPDPPTRILEPETTSDHVHRLGLPLPPRC